jgi:L-fucose mutarotase/ribose pyranase (RbsD/FucU family)
MSEALSAGCITNQPIVVITGERRRFSNIIVRMGVVASS